MLSLSQKIVFVTVFCAPAVAMAQTAPAVERYVYREGNTEVEVTMELPSATPPPAVPTAAVPAPAVPLPVALAPVLRAALEPVLRAAPVTIPAPAAPPAPRPQASPAWWVERPAAQAHVAPTPPRQFYPPVRPSPAEIRIAELQGHLAAWQYIATHGGPAR